jgi:hypothetical protein
MDVIDQHHCLAVEALGFSTISSMKARRTARSRSREPEISQRARPPAALEGQRIVRQPVIAMPRGRQRLSPAPEAPGYGGTGIITAISCAAKQQEEARDHAVPSTAPVQCIANI